MKWRLCLLGCVALACSGRGTQTSESAFDEPTSGDEVVEFSSDQDPPALVSIEPNEQTEVVIVDCQAKVEETCNALDDNCDGFIDEGCGYGGGSIQVTVAWDSGSDVDVYVIDPIGDTLSFQRPSSPSGGRLDHSGRGDCETSMPNPRIENARWVNSRPPPGEYAVVLRYWGECISGGGPTNVVVTVAVGAEIGGSFRYSLVPNERATVLRFVVQ